jgi:hypothetical protein
METYAGLSDEELLRRSRRDPEAFLTFYGRHAAVLFGWLTRETSSRVVAADLVGGRLDAGRHRPSGDDRRQRLLAAIHRRGALHPRDRHAQRGRHPAGLTPIGEYNGKLPVTADGGS